ncbi:FadR/GntR family transcriptional regulator [Microterricola viridarii]|uniref:HTH gntR-type domain-containing protein n=1 Tax=Microterricola viridarii TaxID=412690 RepID=A0A109QXC1_9MICO|nr:FCD domain-containing protein [Microterricola viridarii]AMB59718.1 hypothetical protein AWU67_13560 [Microterricola viridarii]
MFSPIHSAGVSEAIVRRIGELIGSGELRPGDRLPTEAELSQAFEVAPMTVRAALQALRDFHLIETRRGRNGGTFIHADAAQAAYFQDDSMPTITEFADFTVWREAISGEASALVAGRIAAGELTEAEVQRLVELRDASHQAGLSSSAFRFADAEFHRYIAELCGSPRLLDAERSIQASLTKILRRMVQPPNVASLTTQSHTALCAALLAGDPERSRRELRAHVRSTVDVGVGLGYLRAD